jgi:hypothetical protein
VIKAQPATIDLAAGRKWMRYLLIGIGFSSLFCVVACSGTDVPVGAVDGGAGSAGTTSTSGSAGSAGTTPISGGAGGAPQDPRTQAASYASIDITCSVDSDCCVVVDSCLDTGYLVAAKDKDTVRALLDSASMDRCLACIPASVQILCEAGRCAAKQVDDSPGNPTPDKLRQDHCGSIEIPMPTKDVGSQFGCGVGIH